MKFRSIAVMILIVLTTSLVLSACNSGPAATPASGGKIINVETAEFTFTPNKFEAKVGDKLTFKITNKGVLDHSFVIMDADGSVLGRVAVRIGISASLNFTPNKVGTYQIICAEPGHKDSGMVGSIDVAQ
jgi:cytochrome c oxidase subunit 2